MIRLPTRALVTLTGVTLIAACGGRDSGDGGDGGDASSMPCTVLCLTPDLEVRVVDTASGADICDATVLASPSDGSTVQTLASMFDAVDGVGCVYKATPGDQPASFVVTVSAFGYSSVSTALTLLDPTTRECCSRPYYPEATVGLQRPHLREDQSSATAAPPRPPTTP